MKTQRQLETESAIEGSKRWGGVWVLEEVISGWEKGTIQASPKGKNYWWPSNIVRVLASYKNGKRQ